MIVVEESGSPGSPDSPAAAAAGSPEPAVSSLFAGSPGSSAGAAARELASQVLDRLRAGGQTVAVADATELKAELLGVDAMMLRRHGAIYPPVAAAMAQGVRARLGATYGVATTGVAGPDSADGQPVGTAHIAVSVADDTVVRTIALAGDRHEIRRLTVEHVLGLLLGRLREESY
jgi:PncC family amidohydrolase